MYKILIVDDEPHILEGLRHIIDWDEHGIEIAGQAHNGEEALEMLSSMKVHILLTDIRMPKMDGLELIKQIKLKGLNIRSIILSGYDDFEYIKEAVKLGMENYLLKPVNKEELSTTLLNTLEKIDSELYKHISERQGLNTFRENLLYRWLSNSISLNELQEKAPLVNINLKSNEYTAAIVKVLYPRQASNAGVSNDLTLTGFAVQNICGELTEEGTSASTFRDLNGDTVLLFPGNRPSIEKTEMMDILKKCIMNINLYLKLDVFVSVGSTEIVIHEAYKSLSTARELQGYSLIMPKNSIVDQEIVSRESHERREKADIDFEAFNHLLHSRLEDESVRFIEDSFAHLQAVKGIAPVFIQNIAVEFLYHISNSLKSSTKNVQLVNEEMKINFSDVYQMNTIEELTAWLKIIVLKTVEMIKSAEDKYTPLIKQILHYINLNYNKDISIKLLSSSFNINAAYLGQLFKNETGEMLTNFLNNIRVEKAKEMLLNTNMKASEISEKVGYSNTNYFYRIFKKITGISPTEYR